MIQMGKNVTISVPDKLAVKMEALDEVNWSQVARTCFKWYIEQRKNPDITDILESLRKQKGEEYMVGRRYAEELVEEIGYKEFDILIKKYQKLNSEERERAYHGPTGPFDSILSSVEIMETILAEQYDTKFSTASVNGTRERLLEIYRSIK